MKPARIGEVMLRRTRIIGIAAVTTLVVASSTGCSSIGGKDCGDFLSMDEAERDAAVLDWAKKHDVPVKDSDPSNPITKYRLQKDKETMLEYCSQPGHEGDSLDDLRITVGFGG